MVTRSSRRNTPAKKTPTKKGRASTAKKSASSKKGPSYRELQAQCLAAGLSGAGTSAALAERLAAAKEAFDDGEYDSQADNDDTTDNSGSDDDDDSEVDDAENRMLAGAMLDTDESDNSYSDDEEDDLDDYEEEEADSEDEAEMAAVVSDLLNSLDGDSDDEGDYVAVRSGAYYDDEDDEEGGYGALELVDDDDDEYDDEYDDDDDDDDDEEAQCDEEMDMMNGGMLIDLGDDAAGSEVDAQYDAKLGFYSSARMARSFVNILMTVEALCFFVLLFVAVDAAAQHDTAATGMEALLRALVAGGASLAMWQQTVVYVTVFHVAPTVAGLTFGRYWHPQSVLLQSLARYAAYTLLFDAGWLFTDLFALHFPLRVFELTVRVGVALALWEAVQPRATNVYHLGTFI